MSIISNIINTIFNSSGSADVITAADRVGRSQTRLGQASAAAGRSFAAQSQGLGGLVGAYAGAAATTFALEAAFTALANAARAEQTFQGLNALAAGVGVSGEALLTSVRELSNNQLTLAEAAAQTSLTLSAGFSSEQIKSLTEVSLKASRALGRDLTDAMTRVTRGSAKMETELLDELGIYTKIEPSTRAYAAALGKSVTALSEFERRQAFANAVIEEGQNKFNKINTTIPTSAEQIEAFGVKIIDLTTQIGILIANALAPLASFLTNNVAAAFGVLGVVISLVAGKGVQILSAAVASLTTNIVNMGIKAERVIKGFTGMTAAAIQATAAIKTLDATTAALNDPEKAKLKSLQDSAATRNLSNRELKEGEALTKKAITVTRAEIAAQTATRNSLTASINASEANRVAKKADMDAAKAAVVALRQQGASAQALAAAQAIVSRTTGALGAATAAHNRVLNANQAALDAARSRVLGLNVDLNTLTTTLTRTQAALTGFRNVIAGAAAAMFTFGAAVIGGIGMIVSGIIAAVSKIFFFVSIIALIGSAFASATGKGAEFQAVLKSIGDSIKGVLSNENAIRNKAAIQGITAANLAELEKTDSALRDVDSFTFKSKILGFEVEITKTKAELATEVTSLLSSVAEGTEQNQAASGAIIGGGIGVAAGAALGIKLGATLGLFAGPLGAAFGAAIGLAAGAGIGATIGFFTPADIIPPELLDKVRSQFADSLVGLGEESQNKVVQVLATLEDRYGSSARFDPAARAALKVQQQLAIEGGKYLDKIDAVSELMIATGQTADVIVQNFQFDNAERQVNGITTAFMELADKKLSLKFIDIDDSQVQALINTEVMTISTPDTGPMVESFGTETPFAAPIQEAIGSYNLFNQGVIRSLSVTKDLENRLLDGTATLESFTQSITNSRNASNAAERAYFATIAAIEALIQQEAELRDTGGTVNIENADALSSQIIKLQESANLAKDNLVIQRETTEQYAKQEALLTNQNTLLGFFKSFTKEAKNSLNLELDFASVNSKDVLATQIGFLSQFVKDTEFEVLSYNTLVSTLKPLALDTGVSQAILNATAGGEAALEAKLNEIENIEAKLLETGNILITKTNIDGTTVTETISLLERGVAGLGDTSNQATEAIKQLVRQAMENLPDFMNKSSDEINKLVDESKSKIAEIDAEEILLKIKFEADLSQINRDIGIALQEAVIEQLELDIDLVKAKESAGKVSEKDSVAQENALRKQILLEQEYLILQEFGNALTVIEDRRELLEAENKARISAIEAEGLAQINKMQQDQAYVTTIVAMYTAINDTQTATNQALVDGIVSASAIAGSNFTASFNAGATTLNAAIVQGLAASTVFDQLAPVMNTTAPTIKASEGNTIADSIADFGILTASGIDAVEKRIEAEETAEEAAFTRKIDLLDAEQAAIMVNYEARLAALAKQGDIEGYNALARETEAAKAGAESASTDDKLTQVQEKLQQLFDSIKGNIESALMSINNLVFYGEGNLGDIFSNLFKSIQQDFFKTTIADPLSGFLTDSLFGALGVTGMRTGIENAKVVGGALLVSVVSGPADMLNALGGDPTAAAATGATGIFGGFFEGISSLFGKVFGQGGIIANLFSGLFGQGGILSGLFNGIFGGLAGGGIGLAQGGMVHLAQGGAAISASLSRDRVPAMLEPGEFVLRKQSARKIGMPSLQAMNATGTAGGTGNVSINVTNEGSPKQADASPPRFDGEKYVVDVIMRDISNNGPIRRSLRGRGGI